MKRILLTCAALAALASVASANPLCGSNTIAFYIQNYVDMNTACVVGDKLFYNFNYSGTAAGATAPTSAQVNVVGDGSNPYEPGLIFSSNGWTVNGTATPSSPLYIDSNINFTVAVIGLLPLIKGASLDFAGHFAVTGQGVSDIGETVTLGTGPELLQHGFEGGSESKRRAEFRAARVGAQPMGVEIEVAQNLLQVARAGLPRGRQLLAKCLGLSRRAREESMGKFLTCGLRLDTVPPVRQRM